LIFLPAYYYPAGMYPLQNIFFLSTTGVKAKIYLAPAHRNLAV